MRSATTDNADAGVLSPDADVPSGLANTGHDAGSSVAAGAVAAGASVLQRNKNATRDGLYRVSACNICRRYLKAYDGRKALRPLMVGVDTIATLPLDAEAIQRGYVG